MRRRRRDEEADSDNQEDTDSHSPVEQLDDSPIPEDEPTPLAVRADITLHARHNPNPYYGNLCWCEACVFDREECIDSDSCTCRTCREHDYAPTTPYDLDQQELRAYYTLVRLTLGRPARSITHRCACLMMRRRHEDLGGSP
ncbi:MAG: hypothetical protein NVS9B15_05820 [Acidobacteriaceae bacterium]